MIGCMDFRLHIPGPWLQCKDFAELFGSLVLGFSPKPPDSIHPNDHADEATAFLETLEKRIAEADEKAAEEHADRANSKKVIAREMGYLKDANIDISTNQPFTVGFAVDPFKAVLLPLQRHLDLVCKYLRLARWVLCWEECYISFWLTLFCFICSVVSLFVPWFFLFQWMSRLVVWTFLGPWMKLVDILYFGRWQNLSDQELEGKRLAKRLAAREKRKRAHQEALSRARIKREKAVKLQAMKTYMFGKHIVHIPVLKQDRFKDVPRPESYARPYRPRHRPLSEIAMEEAGYHRTRLPGQHFVARRPSLRGGEDIIPRMPTIRFTDAPVGQAIKQRQLVDRTAPAGNLVPGSGPESTIWVYLKLATLLVVSVVFSWFMIPLCFGVVERLLLQGQLAPQT